jgi:excisionase family DNA binding protein
MINEPCAVNAAKPPELKATGLLNVRQVAKILNYSRGWVEEALLDGRIKATRVGGQYRITPEEVKRVMEAGVSAGKSKRKIKTATQIPVESPKPVQAAPPSQPPPPPGPVEAPRVEVKPDKTLPVVTKTPPKPAEPAKKEDPGLFSFLKW